MYGTAPLDSNEIGGEVETNRWFALLICLNGWTLKAFSASSRFGSACGELDRRDLG